VVRKWSYIKHAHPLIITKYNLISTESLPTFLKYKFKTFKHFTRFKLYCIKFTNFTRIKNLIKKRRTYLKSYAIIVSFWVKLYLNYKKIINYIQSCNISLISICIPNVKIPLNKLSSGLNFYFFGKKTITNSTHNQNLFLFQKKKQYQRGKYFMYGGGQNIWQNLVHIKLFSLVNFFQFYKLNMPYLYCKFSGSELFKSGIIKTRLNTSTINKYITYVSLKFLIFLRKIIYQLAITSSILLN